MKKDSLIKKVITFGIVGILALGQNFSALAAASYTYSSGYDSKVQGSSITRYITGTMSGASNYLKLSVYGVYNVRGGGRQVETNGAQAQTTTVASALSTTATYTGTMSDAKNYYAALCCGYYKASSSSSVWSAVTSKDVTF